MDGPQAQVISIVDDDASLRRSLTNLLSSLGFQVEAFASAEAFLQSPHPESTCCIVLDLQMNGMSGLDLLRHLSVTGSRTPVIVLTAHSDDVARQQSLQAGAVAFLEKSLHSDSLLDAIRTSLDHKSGHP